MTNLRSSISADEQAECAREQIADKLEQQFQQITRNVTGSHCRNELDFDEQKGGRC